MKATAKNTSTESTKGTKQSKVAPAPVPKATKVRLVRTEAELAGMRHNAAIKANATRKAKSEISMLGGKIDDLGQVIDRLRRTIESLTDAVEDLGERDTRRPARGARGERLGTE